MRKVALILALAACNPSSPPDTPTIDAGGGIVDAHPGLIDVNVADAGPPQPCQKVDFLFVIDDSPSMVEEQDNLIANFPALAALVDSDTNSAGQPLDYRIAVTTTGKSIDYTLDTIVGNIPQSEDGSDGRFLNGSECGLGHAWLERADGDAAFIATKFSCMADVGTGGPSVEMPLANLELAFGDRVTDGSNAGFLREDALLAIIILTDEDDCSRRDNDFTITDDNCDDTPWPELIALSEMQTELDTLKGGHGRWAIAVIAGDGSDTCSTTGLGESRAEAIRLREFAEMTGEPGVFSSICVSDLAPPLAQALSTFEETCESMIVE
jgi:hypothetical protein